MSILLETKSACFGYGNRRVIETDGLQLRAGQCMGIFGPNGTGKTTLIRGITGLISPLSGQVIKQSQSQPIRFGYIPQQRAMELQWPMTGFDAACLASSAHQLFGWMGSKQKDVKAAIKMLDAEEFAAQNFAKLSGGQQQRLLLAGAIAADPTVLILDEPADGLDVQSRKTFIDLLNRIRSTGVCIVIISHQIDDLLAVAHQIAWLHPGTSSHAPTSVEVITPQLLCERMAHLPMLGGAL